jgi:hypothetical protein
VIERRQAVHRRRWADLDQGVINLGKSQAQVADLACLVSQRFGFVNGAEELGKRQRGAQTDCDEPRAQGRCAHAVDPAPACIRQSLRDSSAVDNYAEFADGTLVAGPPKEALSAVFPGFRTLHQQPEARQRGRLRNPCPEAGVVLQAFCPENPNEPCLAGVRWGAHYLHRVGAQGRRSDRRYGRIQTNPSAAENQTSPTMPRRAPRPRNTNEPNGPASGANRELSNEPKKPLN